ncbi:MAG: InlB B-repeat-containing protein, partial [Lachnospiraceae bacterium]|nr:InlB B-repeat-containing protein [Lachnospiraceae bacterium]
MIDITKKDRDTLAGYDGYWSDGMTVSCDTGDGNQKFLEAYAKKVRLDLESMDEYGYPLIAFYIDAQNRLQYMEVIHSSYSGVDNIMFNLRAFCNYPTAGAKFYDIKYVLNGGTNNYDNPEIYHTEMEENIVLKDLPDRYSYAFDGWYTDATFYDRITEIKIDEARDITLYAKWRYKGPGYDNFEHTFKKVGGGTVSSEAENGRPKLLIFANQNCGFTPGVITGIRDNIEWFQGVDIVCAVVTKTTVDEANAYIEAQKNENGCDGITFAYDDSSSGNANLTWAYIRRAISPLPDFYISPMLIYIDGDNKFQFAGGGGKPDQLLDNLRQYCNYGAYRINYETYGGVNNSENPAVYFEDSEDIVLKAPFMRGYQFEGWYRDPEYKKQVTEIPKGSTADYKLYAKWKVGGLSRDNLTQEYTALDDTTITSEAS